MVCGVSPKQKWSHLSPADVFALLGLLFLESSPAGINLDLNLCKYRSAEVSCVGQNQSWNENAGFAHGLELSLK